MAKRPMKAKKSKRRKKKVVNEVFLGNLHSVTKAITAAVRLVERGRKKALAAVSKGTAAPIGSPARNDLAFNQEALKQADHLLECFRSAKGLMVACCCHNTENCNFAVRTTRVGTAR